MLTSPDTCAVYGVSRASKALGVGFYRLSAQNPQWGNMLLLENTSKHSLVCGEFELSADKFSLFARGESVHTLLRLCTGKPNPDLIYMYHPQSLAHETILLHKEEKCKHSLS